MMKKLLLSVALGAACLDVSPLFAAEVDTLYVRAKFGPTFYSNLDPMESALGFGLDLGFRSASGFGVAGIGRMNLNDSGSATSGGTTVYANAKSTFIGVAPTYSVTKGIATWSFGLGIGAFSVSTEVETTVANIRTTYPRDSKSRLALMPHFEMDFEVGAGVFLNAGVQYIAAIGTKPNPSAVSPMGGFGYRF